MKLTKTKKSKGITLIELTVVILVLLSLISVLFVGARAWLRGSDRAQSALVIRNAQQGVRSHTNLLGLRTPREGEMPLPWMNPPGAIDPLPGGETLQNSIFGPELYVETETVGVLPPHPGTTAGGAAITYVQGPAGFEMVPPLGTPYIMSSAERAFFDPEVQ